MFVVTPHKSFFKNQAFCGKLNYFQIKHKIISKIFGDLPLFCLIL